MKTTVATAVLGLVLANTVAAIPADATSSPAATGTSSGSAGAVSTGSAAPAAPSSSNEKFVWAHHMLGVTEPYTQDDWNNDVSNAKKAGIDGFALNMGKDAFQPKNAEMAYNAAQQAGDFKVFFSFDMTSLSCNSTDDAKVLSDLVNKYAGHAAQVKYQNKPLVSTFGGERCTFGAASVEAGWEQVRSGVQNGGMYFMPATFMTPDQVKDGKWYDGGMQWDAAWPMDDSDPNTKNDTAWMDALGDKGYMAPVSPFFFTYYPPDHWDKNWIYRSDDWLMSTRFEQLIGMRDKIDMVQVVSWNDYGESHYICPLPSADRRANATWTEDMPHEPLLTLIKYYADAFRNGSYPEKPEDGIWLWSRPHPKDAKPTNPTLERPARADWTEDKLYVIVTLSAPATVEITSGSNKGSQDLQAGLHKLTIDSAAGPIGATITRDGKQVTAVDSKGKFEYTETPKDYNFNYFVASTGGSGNSTESSSAAPSLNPVGSTAIAAVLATVFWAAI